ncbi:hypothetical protein DSM106972_051770 [Dulcicalothrix desertica PCC 7102]|uniref:Uncharacterized protein n=1 Tax=Dulcicalothrix desertica PCC 7102 TaxID=232991 RepID=A0A3S1CHI8_9CYAN|nr:hypothetical protein [Dulcicalothrix desertica]RUT03538.1 hypothetical protein DSM106972_051770 [Dulcicalothrix desertica PCC 7102]
MEQPSQAAPNTSTYYYHRDTEYTEKGIVESMKEAKAPKMSKLLMQATNIKFSSRKTKNPK